MIDDSDRREPQKLPLAAWAKPGHDARYENIEAISQRNGGYDIRPEDIEPAVDLSKFERDMNRNRIDDIKAIVRALTYGEMMELVGQVTKSIPEYHAEKRQGSEDWMPSMFHAWATS
jgi:hypothetical protein